KSGGHILPCLTLAQQFNCPYPSIHSSSLRYDEHSGRTGIENQQEHTIIFFSTDASLDKAILHNQSKQSLISHHITLALGQFSSIPVYRHIQIMWQLTHAWIKSLYHLHKHKPNKVISTGGLIAVPVCLAAWLLRIPIELYELNAVPGKAIKALAPIA